ncbi:MAG: phage baseplate assembly protein V [Terriglobales bacterium]
MNSRTGTEQLYLGKYRGTVINNVDPDFRGRLQVEVPDVVSLLPTSWAEPCVPLAGPTGPAMGLYMVPPMGAGVWIEFEHGDSNKPIWTGCRWGASADVPPSAKLGLPISPPIVFQTAGQHMLSISDMPGPTGGIVIKIVSGASIMINELGITIQNGQGASIALMGPTVTINQGALVVT